MRPWARRALVAAGLMAVVTPGGMARAQPAPGTIVGEVRTAAEGTPLPAANLQLEGTLLGGITDRGGRYRIPGVPPGSYRLRVSVVGYRTETATVAVVSGGTVTVDVRLEIAPIALPDVVVTAGRQQQRADEAAAAVAILEGPRLALRGARQLDTVLPLVPGVTMMDDQVGIRGSTGYTRGAGGRVLVLQDGVPVVGGDTGNVRWDTLPAEAVERVEVVKGATSSLYGSAAMGGVVNVITRSAHTGPFTSVRLRTGTWDQPWYEDYRWSEGRRWSRGGEATLVRPVGRLGLLVTGGYLRSDGFRQNGGEEKKHLLAKLEGPLEGRDHWDVVLTAALHDHDNFFEWAGPDDPYEVAAAVRGDWIRSDKLTLTSSWRRLLSPSAYIQVQPHFSAVRWSNHFADNNDAAEVLRSGIDLQRVHTWGDASLTVGGMAALTGVEADMYGSVRVGEGAVFTQHERGLSERVRMSVGARLDFHQARGLEHHLVVSPRLALVADPLPGLVLRLAGGRGFRAPSVAETYVSTTTSGFQVIPNTALTPETAWTFEAGAVWDPLPVIDLELNVFTGRWSDMIEPVARPEDGAIQFQNLRRARLQGVELAVRAASPDGRLRAGWSGLLLSARDLDVGEPLSYRRPRQSSLTLEGTLLGVVLGADWRYGATVEKVQLYPYDRRAPLRRLDGRVSVPLFGLRLTVQGNNLTQYYYTDIERNLAAPREWLVTLERSW